MMIMLPSRAQKTLPGPLVSTFFTYFILNCRFRYKFVVDGGIHCVMLQLMRWSEFNLSICCVQRREASTIPTNTQMLPCGKFVFICLAQPHLRIVHISKAYLQIVSSHPCTYIVTHVHRGCSRMVFSSKMFLPRWMPVYIVSGFMKKEISEVRQLRG
jgi:hypothetical protein